MPPTPPPTPTLTPIPPERAAELVRAFAAKPGVKTSEFWACVSAAVVPWLVEAVPPSWKAAVSGVVAVGYAIARAITKLRK